MSTPLRELINRLAVDSTSQAAFAADPARFLAEHGWADLGGEDVGTALSALADEAPIDQAVRLNDIAEDDAVAGLEAAAAVFAEPNGQLADPDLGIDRDDRDPSLGIDDGPDGPDRLDDADDGLESAFRGTHEGDDDELDDGEDTVDLPELSGRTDDGDVDVEPDVVPEDPTGGIDELAGHESFEGTDDDSDVDLPEPEDDDDL
jgi:hypothetical protein